jgi:TP901 family phage tail tape measure protein
MPNYNLGSITGKIQIDYDGRGTREATKDVEGLGNKAKGQSALISGVGKVATGAGLAIAAGLGLAIKASSDFEKELSGIKAVSGATAQEMDQIRDAAMRIGKETSFSATDAAKAMAELSKAGVSTADILNGAADATVALAAAGGVELPLAAEIAANALNLFGLEGKDMARVTDLIAGAANKSAIDVGDFGYSMAAAGTAADLVGLSFDDMAVAITAMGNAGIKGSDAGTSLKTMLLNLQPSTKEQIALFQELGLVTAEGSNQFFDAQGNIKSLADIAGVLETALQGMTKEQKIAALEVLFGSDAIRAAAIVAEQGKKGFEELGQAITSVKAADVASTRLDNLAGSVEQLKGSLETAAIGIGTALTPALRGVVDGITNVINWFNNLSPTAQKWIAIGLAVAAGLLLLAGAVIAVIGAIVAFKAALAVAGLAFIPLIIVAIKVIAIIALIAAAVYLIIKYWEPIKNFFINLWNSIVGAFQAALAWIQGVGTWIVDSFNGMVAWFQALPGRIGAWLASVYNAAITWIGNLVNGILQWFASLPGKLAELMLAVGEAILSAFRALPGLLGTLIGFIIGVIISIPIVVVKGLQGLGMLLVNLFITAFTWLLETTVTLVTNIINFLQELPGKIIAAIATLAVLLYNWATEAWNRAYNAVVTGIENTISFLQALPGKIIAAIASLAVQLGNWARSAWQTAQDAVAQGINNMINFVRELPGKILQALGNLGNLLWEAGRSLISGFINGIKDMIGNAVSAAGDVVSAVRDFFPFSPAKEGPFSGRGYTSYSGKALVTDFAKSIYDASPEVQSAMNQLMTAAHGEFSGSATFTAAATTGTERATTPVGNTIVIENLTIPIDAHLDPTNALEWRRAMAAIETGITDYRRSYQ